jgi:plasmid stabilization system protein ParE
MKVRYTLRAYNDVHAIHSYLDQRSPAAAQAVKGIIERRIRQLADFPLLAPMTEEPGVYELTVVRYPYKVYYRVENDEIWVLHIRHTSRRSPDPAHL